MIIENLLTTSYKTISPYHSTKSIENDLIVDKFIVIVDSDNSFLGLLTLTDLIKNRRNIVIDCLTCKPHISKKSSVSEVITAMKMSSHPALPVFDDSQFIGAISFDNITNYFFSYQKELENKIMEQNIKLYSITEQLNIEKNMRFNAENIISENKIFNAYISHELKNPINSIVGYSSILLLDQLSDDQKSSIQAIHSSGMLLNSIIEDTLSFSKISFSSNKHSEFFINNLIDDVYQIVKFDKIQAQISLNKNIDTSIKYILFGDQVKLKQIILNLVKNAIKYTENGIIETIIQEQEKNDSEVKLKFIIKDTGIGISEKNLPYIFDNHYRIENIHTTQNPGYGLGLPITKKLIENLGGKINVKSSIDAGSEFSFSLIFKYSKPAD